MLYILLFYIAITLAAIIAVFIDRRRSPAAVVCWLTVVTVLPLVGVAVYVMAGWHGRKTSPVPRRTVLPMSGIHRLIHSLCHTLPTRHNRVQPLHDAAQTYTALFRAIHSARRTVHLEYYIFDCDRVGNALCRLLARKARAGVRVRLLCDAQGSSALNGATVQQLRASGVEIVKFRPLKFPYITPWIARRDHRKIAVIDSRMAFLGGINIAQRYIDGNAAGRWRDEHVAVEGEAVAELERLFVRQWVRAGGTEIRLPSRVAMRTDEVCRVQVFWSDAFTAGYNMCDILAAVMHSARRRLWIATPYFAPTEQIMDALRVAVLSGADVRIVVPQRCDSPLVERVMQAYLRRVAEVGVRVYCYTSGFLHSKYMVVDTAYVSIGTVNLDYRSLRDNEEVNVLIADSDIVARYAAVFETDTAADKATEPALFGAGSDMLQRASDAIVSLLAPFV